MADLIEINNHLAASIIKSKLPLVKIPINKGIRYIGHSKMNYVSLILHGLKAISVLYSSIKNNHNEMVKNYKSLIINEKNK